MLFPTAIRVARKKIADLKKAVNDLLADVGAAPEGASAGTVPASAVGVTQEGQVDGGDVVMMEA